MQTIRSSIPDIPSWLHYYSYFIMVTLLCS